MTASGEHLSKKRFEEDENDLNIVEQYLKLNEKISYKKNRATARFSHKNSLLESKHSSKKIK